MNKNTSKQDANSQISRIKANLKQMKEEVNQYLKKQSNDKVPPVLKARHYLILNCINDAHGIQNNVSTENIKFKNQSIEKPERISRANSLKPVLNKEANQKQKANKTVKQKRAASDSTHLNASLKCIKQEINCLQPNICTLNLQISQKIKPQVKCQTSRKKILQHKLNESLNASLLYRLPENDRRYHSIDFSKHASKSKLDTLNAQRALYMGNRSIQIALNQQIQNYCHNPLNKLNFNYKIDDYLSNSAMDNMSSWKIQNKGQQTKERLNIESLLQPNLNQKQSISTIKLPPIKRRIYSISIPASSNVFANRNNLPRDWNNFTNVLPIIQNKAKLLKKKKHPNQVNQTNQCSPWQQNNDFQTEKAEELLQNSFL